MRKKVLIAAGATAAIALTMAGCSSSSDTSTGGSGSAANSGGASSGSGADINVGVITSLTGGYASGFTTVEKGVKARLDLENANGGVDGHKLTYTMADDASTASGALSGAQKLIKQDKVYAILDASASFYGAAPAAKSAATPVLGLSFDGGDAWQDPQGYPTFFDAYGYGDFSLAATTFGTFFKAQGCAKVGAIGNTGPSSGRAAQSAVISAQKAGLQAGYLDSKLAPGTTDVGPQVIGLKTSGTDCLYMPVTPSLGFAVVAGLKQAGVTMKAVVLGTGYGDIVRDKAAVQAGQGVDFMTIWSPVEADTDATKQFQNALSEYAGVTGVPTTGEYYGWTIADLFVYGLKQAGGGAPQAEFVSKLRASDGWDAGGLFTSPTTFADPDPVAAAMGPGNCVNMVKLSGSQFQPIAGANPVCGDIIEGTTIKQ